ncbi:polysaccharide deacetylase family protein [Alkalihalobacillus sp. AL-G]|uniref:polysaccharide deacetylase family protein n=1 Tax=Alkalihalobacillus sp. AL-G TaxID=2926399 RepID=UPI0027298C2F|nr:polysaccharide deacetylase family protein [Alkalihalobacillus sp. AL-G]WLD95200.1 polysaccharide deacetylase family protein [Alkalihalobacillus sp. AL-G]
MRRHIHIVIVVVLLIVTYSIIQNPLSHRYIETLKGTSQPVSNQKVHPDKLLEQIKTYASKRNELPINARIDPVWKAIPGYNGILVDVDASYDRMKKKGKFDLSLIVYKQTSPEVTLNDLPPAPIFRGNPNKPMVTFLINVAWGNEYLPGMLETLKEHKIHVTFFLDGSWVRKNQEMAKIIYEEGHEIGNHAYSHPDMRTLTNGRIEEEIRKTNEMIESTLNVTPAWFAPPSGSWTNNVVNVAASLKMKTILWSVDTIDWRKPDPEQMANRIIDNIHPGAVVLMHPTVSTEKALDQMIKGVQEKGYSIGTVSQLMNEKRVIRSDTKVDFDKKLSK